METTSPKQQLIDKVNEYIQQNESDGKMYMQQNAIFVRTEVLPKVRALNEMQACKLKRVIDKREEYDPTKDKWDFGPVVVSPSDYASFIKDALAN